MSPNCERCPFLPEAEERAGALAALGRERGEDFYRTALARAQGLWVAGEPAQAILRLNRAWAASLRGDEGVLKEWPSPFRALRWMLERAPEGRFLGNPVRHFQHLATRMNEDNREARVARAWACFHLAERVLGMERDEAQIVREGVAVPTLDEALAELARCGWPGEADECRAALAGDVSGGGR